MSNMPFRYCLNTSTIQGEKRPLLETIRIVGQAGYSAIEPWIKELDSHEKSGGALADIRKALSDNGLTAENAIGFFEWAVEDAGRRSKGLEEARRNFDQVARIGGKRLAAPPFGAHAEGSLDLVAAAERYYQLCELGRQFGVVPVVEFWGASKNLSRLSEAAMVAVGAGHPDASLLADIYHMYRGGSPVEGLRMIRGAAIGMFHINDYPANPPREAIGDADRVYPGDGVAPLGQLYRTLREIGYAGCLSLELFNRSYWAQDPLTVARTGLEKLKATVERALA